MITQITIDQTAILQMAFVAMLFAILMPVDRTPGIGRLGETGRALARSLCGILVAVSSWSTIQVLGSAFGDRPAPQVQVPLVLMPKQAPVFPPSPPGRDI